ncbi:MAG: alpha/beta fold hydrolase, partial [Planctomycetota bacterium JB042]
MLRPSAPPTTLLALALGLSLPAPPALAGGPCTDPAAPDGGFAIVETTVPVTRSDGYVSLTDVRHPADPPGPCGWPLVMVIHGGGGDRGVVAGLASNLASRGYVTCAYDVRGQGPSMALNPLALAHDLVGLRELIDLFEAMESVEALLPTLVDFERIGVTGYSQGGSHSWWAAQHSGRLPPPNAWRTAPFPAISAVVVRDSTAALGSAQANAFNARRIEKLFAPSGITYRPSVVAPLQALVLADDVAGYQAATLVPGMDPLTLLPLVTVPVLAHASYDDKRVNPSGVAAAWSLVPDTTPKRIHLGTGGHDSPQNEHDFGRFNPTRVRWFDRFLKGEANGVDLEPRVRADVTPEAIAAYLDADALWDFREGDDLPLAGVTTTRLHLAPGGPNGALVETAPAAATSSPLVHVVPAGFDMTAYTSLLPNATQLATIVPPDTIRYDSAPRTEDAHLHGDVRVELSIDTLDPDHQVCASLFDVAPGGAARFVCRGGAAIRGQPGAGTVAFSLYRQSYVFRAGHRIRLQIENLAVHRPPTGNPPETKLVPMLSSSTVNVLEGGAAPSFVDLPLLPFADPTLTTGPLFQSVAAPEDQLLAIHSHSGRAGDPYLLLPSLSGTSPSTNVLGVEVPIVFDAVTSLWAANPGLPPFVGMAGQ